MKKFSTIIALTMAALVTLVFSSCETDDFDTAANLNGTWRGSLGQYYNTVYGTGYSEWETEFRFENYAGNTGASTSGQGVEIDFDPDYWSDYKYYEFRWEVAYGNIYLHYSNGDELVIRNYSMSGDRIRGVLETYDGIFVANLDLYRTSYWPWGSSYAKGTRAAEDQNVGQPRKFK